jgi:plastocyanin
MKRRTFLAAAGSTATVGLAGCLGGTPDLAENEIGMSTRAFEPGRKTVSVGTTVRWRNTDRGVHTVTAYEGNIPEEADYFASGGFDSESAARDAWFQSTDGGINSGGTFEYTVEVPGEYKYFCIPHEASGMIGTLVVEE